MDMSEKLIQSTLIPTNKVASRKDAIQSFEIALSHIILNLQEDSSDNDMPLAKHREWLLATALVNLDQMEVLDFEKLRTYVNNFQTYSSPYVINDNAEKGVDQHHLNGDLEF